MRQVSGSREYMEISSGVGRKVHGVGVLRAEHLGDAVIKNLRLTQLRSKFVGRKFGDLLIASKESHICMDAQVAESVWLQSARSILGIAALKQALSNF